MRQSCATSAETSTTTSSGSAASNQPAMLATACRIPGQPSGAQCSVGGVRAASSAGGAPPDAAASKSDGIATTSAPGLSGGIASGRAQNTVTGRARGRAFTSAAQRVAWPRPWWCTK